VSIQAGPVTVDRAGRRDPVDLIGSGVRSASGRSGPPSASAVVSAVVIALVVAAAGLAVLVAGASPSGPTTVRYITAPGLPAPTPIARAAGQPVPVPARIGEWTPRIGLEIARRARSWVGWPYSFGGGDAAGPTYGHAVDHDSRNDGKVRGFDCSGLTLWAMAPWRALTHFAATQYTQAGSLHPALSDLLPGDLVFWSPDGTVAGIGHVAVYLGDGLVVQAPKSGDHIRITPIDQVEAGARGATRPLT